MAMTPGKGGNQKPTDKSKKPPQKTPVQIMLEKQQEKLRQEKEKEAKEAAASTASAAKTTPGTAATKTGDKAQNATKKLSSGATAPAAEDNRPNIIRNPAMQAVQADLKSTLASRKENETKTAAESSKVTATNKQVGPSVAGTKPGQIGAKPADATAKAAAAAPKPAPVAPKAAAPVTAATKPAANAAAKPAGAKEGKIAPVSAGPAPAPLASPQVAAVASIKPTPAAAAAKAEKLAEKPKGEPVPIPTSSVGPQQPLSVAQKMAALAAAVSKSVTSVEPKPTAATPMQAKENEKVQQLYQKLSNEYVTKIMNKPNKKIVTTQENNKIEEILGKINHAESLAQVSKYCSELRKLSRTINERQTDGARPLKDFSDIAKDWQRNLAKDAILSLQPQDGINIITLKKINQWINEYRETLKKTPTVRTPEQQNESSFQSLPEHNKNAIRFLASVPERYRIKSYYEINPKKEEDLKKVKFAEDITETPRQSSDSTPIVEAPKVPQNSQTAVGTPEASGHPLSLGEVSGEYGPKPNTAPKVAVKDQEPPPTIAQAQEALNSLLSSNQLRPKVTQAEIDQLIRGYREFIKGSKDLVGEELKKYMADFAAYNALSKDNQDKIEILSRIPTAQLSEIYTNANVKKKAIPVIINQRINQQLDYLLKNLHIISPELSANAKEVIRNNNVNQTNAQMITNLLKFLDGNKKQLGDNYQAMNDALIRLRGSIIIAPTWTPEQNIKAISNIHALGNSYQSNTTFTGVSLLMRVISDNSEIKYKWKDLHKLLTDSMTNKSKSETNINEVKVAINNFRKALMDAITDPKEKDSVVKQFRQNMLNDIDENLLSVHAMDPTVTFSRVEPKKAETAPIFLIDASKFTKSEMDEISRYLSDNFSIQKTVDNKSLEIRGVDPKGNIENIIAGLVEGAKIIQELVGQTKMPITLLGPVAETPNTKGPSFETFKSAKQANLNVNTMVVGGRNVTDAFKVAAMPVVGKVMTAYLASKHPTPAPTVVPESLKEPPEQPAPNDKGKRRM